MVGFSVSLFVSRLLVHSFDWLLGWLGGWLIGCIVGSLVGRLVGWVFGHSVGLSVSWSLCWLLREQVTFSPASPVPIKGYFWNCVSRIILASATNGASLVGIGQLQRAHSLKNTAPFHLYLCLQ
jgi:hypothetical protein